MSLHKTPAVGTGHSMPSSRLLGLPGEGFQAESGLPGLGLWGCLQCRW